MGVVRAVSLAEVAVVVVVAAGSLSRDVKPGLSYHGYLYITYYIYIYIYLRVCIYVYVYACVCLYIYIYISQFTGP